MLPIHLFIIFGNGHWRDQGAHTLWSFLFLGCDWKKYLVFSFSLMLVGEITAFFCLLQHSGIILLCNRLVLGKGVDSLDI